MKKLFTFASLLAAACFAVSAENIVVETIDATGLATAGAVTNCQGWNGPFTSESIYYGDYDDVCDSSVFGPEVGTGEDNAWFMLNYGSYAYNMYVNDGWYIKSITIETTNGWGSGNVYFNDTPMSPEDKSSAAEEQYFSQGGSVTVTTLTATTPASYWLLDCMQSFIKKLTIEWTDEAPVPDCPDPDVSIENEWDGVCTGAKLTVNKDYKVDGLTLLGYIYDGEKEVEVYTDELPYEYIITAKTGESFSYQLYYEKDGYNPSYGSSKEYTIVDPKAGLPVHEDLNPLYVGKEITISAPEGIEGASIKYLAKYSDWDNGIYDQVLIEETVAAAPVTFTLPECPLGAYVSMQATVVAEGYRENLDYWGANVVSLKLDAPVLRNGWQNYDESDELQKGTVLTLARPNNATEIHYILNGVEEVVSTEWSVDLQFDVTTELVAWATGEEPFEASERVTYMVTIEHLGTDVDCITPNTVVPNLDAYLEDEGDAAYKLHYLTQAAGDNGAEYLYHGGVYSAAQFGDLTPYLYASDANYSRPWFVANTTTGGFNVTAIRIDAKDDSNNAFAVYMDDAPMATAVENPQEVNFTHTEMTDNTPAESFPYFVIGADNEWGNWHGMGAFQGGFVGKWVNLAEVEAAALEANVISEENTWNNKPYFFIRVWNSSSYPQVSRVLIRYSSTDTSVSDLVEEVSEEEAVYYNLNGLRVDKDNLAPGLYIRVAGSNASKVLVK